MQNFVGKTKCIVGYMKVANLRDKVDISESIDILTSDDMENTPLESRMWFRMNFTSGVFSSKSTRVYIINSFTDCFYPRDYPL